MLVCQCVSPIILLLLGVQQATSDDNQLFASNTAGLFVLLYLERVTVVDLEGLL